MIGLAFELVKEVLRNREAGQVLINKDLPNSVLRKAEIFESTLSSNETGNSAVCNVSSFLARKLLSCLGATDDSEILTFALA